MDPKNGIKNQKFHNSDSHYFMIKRIERSGFWRGFFQIRTIPCKKNFGFSRFVFKKTKKNIYTKYRSTIHPTDCFEGCRQKSKAKKVREGMQADKGEGGLSMNTPLFKRL